MWARKNELCWAPVEDAGGGGGQDPSFLRWIMGDNVDDVGNNGSSFGLIDPLMGLEPNPFGAQANNFQSLSLPTATTMSTLSLPLPPVFLQEPIEEKPIHFSPNLILNHHQQLPPPQNPSFFLPLPQFNSHIETHHPHFPDSANGNSLFLRRNQLQNPSFSNPKVKDEFSGHQQAIVDQLFKAAELVEAGNSIGARGILARLNHQLPSFPVIGKPLFRSAFYFKEALLLLANNNPPNSPLSTPLDVLLKLGTYKAFSEISPIVQFTNFTSIQAILEELHGCNKIHVVDFDVGVGGHWSSFLQELAHRRGGATPSLKITAFVSHSSHHPLELHLTRENLSHFAAELNIPFEFNALSLEGFDPSAFLAVSSPDEAIAVNFPIGSVLNYQSIPTVLRFVKQLNPKIVVSVEHGCDRSDLPFSTHFLHAFQACTILLDSIDASGANQDVANKIERYLVQPRIENVVLCRHRSVEKMVPWRALFASAGFVPFQFSNFTETQAECLLKRVQVRGFQVEKRQASLFLCWQRGELVSVSAWKC
ncbi:uncharacterized protein A4U43_C08F2120 [Asparagus officinalis]|nr:uncharacterized protein A4U43_C08F2120 [Asparagus officinalis]